MSEMSELNFTQCLICKDKIQTFPYLVLKGPFGEGGGGCYNKLVMLIYNNTSNKFLIICFSEFTEEELFLFKYVLCFTH